mmetsp:Transcript_21172/g.55055  ORF Transcript_21172/g.55055 Transcript_21172/m.55055 type:complete len:128 (+) Transcript_21172:546-929(+)
MAMAGTFFLLGTLYCLLQVLIDFLLKLETLCLRVFRLAACIIMVVSTMVFVAPKPWMDRRAALDISAAFEILTFIAYLLFFASHHVNFRHLDVTVAVSDVRASSEARPGEQEMSAVEVFEGAGAEGA